MKKSFLNKLKSYSISAGAVTIVSPLGANTVDYTDIDPDVTISAPSYFQLDLNNMSPNDFAISLYAGTYNSTGSSSAYGQYTFFMSYRTVGIYAYGQNKFAGFTNTYFYSGSQYTWISASEVMGGSTISAGNNWIGQSNPILTYSVTAYLAYDYTYVFSYTGGMGGVYTYNNGGGKFLNKKDKYLGLQLIVAPDTFYG
ncbi:MAG: hypothetical protein IH948_01290, partial [Bacteroidetes bacterium]|nr:hypothetical protein [Bacteroidota bacterium]